MKNKLFESIVDETVSANYTENDKKRIDKKKYINWSIILIKNGKVVTEL